MNEKIDFAMKCLTTSNFRQLCQEHGISAKTGYKWKERFINNGLAGLEDESRRPTSHADELPEAVVCEMVLLKQAHPHWGPRKIRDLYERRHPGATPRRKQLQARVGAGRIDQAPEDKAGRRKRQALKREESRSLQ